MIHSAEQQLSSASPAFDDADFTRFLEELQGMTTEELLHSLPTSSQACISLFDASARPAIRAAYDIAKASVEKQEQPDWKTIWEMHLVSVCPVTSTAQVQQSMEQFFAKAAQRIQEHVEVFRSFADRQIATLTDASGSRAAAAAARCRTPLGALPNHSALQPRADQGSASKVSAPVVATASRSAADAVAGRPRAGMRTWIFEGVFRWRGAGVVVRNEAPLSGEDILAAHATVKQVKGRKKMPLLREKWRCRTCGSVYHEHIGATSNLTRHTKKCAARPTIDGTEAEGTVVGATEHHGTAIGSTSAARASQSADST
ncbi:hypothetical protein V8E36_006028 [Tilletia maclaganii]